MQRPTTQEIIDATMMGVAERILVFANEIEVGKSPDLGSVRILRAVAQGLVMATDAANNAKMQ